MAAIAIRNAAAIWIVMAIGLLGVIAGAIRTSGLRPYGEQAILAQIEREDGALCGKFGIAVTTPTFSDCLTDLADLRRRHVELLTAYGWL
jgi:hypothetical protein